MFSEARSFLRSHEKVPLVLRGNPFFLLFYVISNYELDSVRAPPLSYAQRRNIKLILVEMDKHVHFEIKLINNFTYELYQKFRSQKFINHLFS